MNTHSQNQSSDRQAFVDAFAAFEKGEHTAEQFDLLMDALPPDVRQSMNEKALEILGLDPKQPDAYGDDGQPLWLLNRQKLIDDSLSTEEEFQALEARFLPITPKPDPKVSVLDRRVKLDQAPFVKTDELDEDGNPVYLVSPEGWAIMGIDFALQHNTGIEPCPKAIELVNRWLSLAAQRGVSSIIIERLREATRKPVGRHRLLADVARVTKKASMIEVFELYGAME